MAESTLSLAYTEVAAEVGSYLGFGRGTSYSDPAWSTQQKNMIDSCVKSGLRQFYFPPPIDGSGSTYDWSFLKPTVTMTLASGVNTLALPDDFGGFEGQITVLGSTNQVCWPIPLCNEGQIREAYSQYPVISGRPTMAAIQPLKGTTGSTGQRFQLFFFPSPDAAYTVQFQYYLLADFINGTISYAYGGMAHAETILESCLAIAEQRIDGSNTVHSGQFLQRLAASIGKDRQYKAQTLGYNADRSDGCWSYRGWNHYQDTILIQGNQY
jgi:hypothetical protein